MKLEKLTLLPKLKLLRFLESKSIERLGSSKTLDLDVRLVCATNRNLHKMVQEGDFREDLYYRLNVITIELPPLRQRGDDFSLLLNHFLSVYSEVHGFDPPTLSSATFKVFYKIMDGLEIFVSFVTFVKT